MQQGPSITDWMQGSGTLAALALSLSSLLWQWRVREKANRERISIEATRRQGGAWTAEMSVRATDRSTALYAEVQIRNWSSSRLYHDDGPPWITVDFNNDFAAMKREDWSDLRADLDLHMAAINLDLEFYDKATSLATGNFGIFPSGDEVDLRVTVFARGTRRRILQRNISVSPVSGTYE